MNQSSSSKSDRNNFDDDGIESDRLFPPSKRLCQTLNSKICLPDQSSDVLIDLASFNDNKEGCKSCGKQETLLKTFNCPSLHYFCLNCIFNWTQKHIQTKTSPICLVTDCRYSLKVEDLDDLPIAMKDHQILLQLIELKIDNTIPKPTNFRIKCDKCYLYIDQHSFFSHHNECLGRSLTIPCEICYCPILIDDYEQHMLICTNDDNSTLSQFLFKHLQNPNMDEKMIKLFISSWQRKHRRTIDIYEMIEELNQATTLAKEICDVCKQTVQYEEFHFLNCENSHSSCLVCYKQHVQTQMNNNQILTCSQCNYHLQDKDLSETRLFTTEQVLVFQNYQNKKILELYHQLYGVEDTVDLIPAIPPPTRTTNRDETSRRKCEVCAKQHFYDDIFVLNCNCKICYDCFANEVQQQQTKTNELLICVLCRTSIKHNDLANLRLTPPEIQAIQLYQQGKLFENEHAVHFNRQKSSQTNNNSNHDNDDDDDDYALDIVLLNQQQCLPKYWTLPMINNFSRHPLNPQSTEYIFVSEKFYQSWGNLRNQPPIPTPVPPPGIPTRRATPLPPPPPPPTSVSVPLSHPHPPYMVAAQLFPRMPMLYSTTNNSINNNNNGLVGNQPLPPPPMPLPPPSNHTFGPLLHPMPLGTNSMIHPGSLPPLQGPPPGPPPPPMPYHPQQTHQPAMIHTRARAPSHLPTNNPTLRTRQPRSTPAIPNTPQIVQIERVQNQRWYKQYAAHECEFRQKLGKQTEQWLFHGCDERSSKNIEVECFNRSYAGQHAVAYGQGCYFAKDSVYSHSYAPPDRNGIRRMFLARVLVGNTCQGNSTMRVSPLGFDTTGDGQSIFVTYHDSQAYAEYLITYR